MYTVHNIRSLMTIIYNYLYRIRIKIQAKPNINFKSIYPLKSSKLVKRFFFYKITKVQII